MIQSQWQAVSNKYPNEGTTVLVWSEGKQRVIRARYMPIGPREYGFLDDDNHQLRNITHWRPLSEPT